jgi:hypothetical protein
MKAFITALAIAFVLATVTSMIALRIRGDHAQFDQGRYTADHQRMALLYWIQTAGGGRKREC